MMIKIFSICFFVFSFQFSSFSQLKKKKFGTYAGVISSYELNTGFKQIDVSSTPISILLTADSLHITIGNEKLKGPYLIVLETKEYTVIEGWMLNQIAVERILVFRNKRKISREGIKPQPDAVLGFKSKIKS